MAELPDIRTGERRAEMRGRAELYRRFGREIFELSLAHQRYEGVKQVRPLSDAEIALRLGLTEEEVADLRCVAEVDQLSTDWFREADAFKKGRSR